MAEGLLLWGYVRGRGVGVRWEWECRNWIVQVWRWRRRFVLSRTSFVVCFRYVMCQTKDFDICTDVLPRCWSLFAPPRLYVV